LLLVGSWRDGNVRPCTLIGLLVFIALWGTGEPLTASWRSQDDSRSSSDSEILPLALRYRQHIDRLLSYLPLAIDTDGRAQLTAPAEPRSTPTTAPREPAYVGLLLYLFMSLQC
jgi:hypothetical protein